MGNFNSTYRRLGVLSGNKTDGFYCEICNKEIKTSGHYIRTHPDLYEMAKAKRNL